MIRSAAIVSLSSGVLGESFVKHELDIGLKRLQEYGINVRFMPHALKGLEYVRDHPENGRRICCRLSTTWRST